MRLDENSTSLRLCTIIVWNLLDMKKDSTLLTSICSEVHVVTDRKELSVGQMSNRLSSKSTFYSGRPFVEKATISKRLGITFTSCSV